MALDRDICARQFCQNDLKSIKRPNSAKRRRNAVESISNRDCSCRHHRFRVCRDGRSWFATWFNEAEPINRHSANCCTSHRYHRRGGIASGRLEQVLPQLAQRNRGITIGESVDRVSPRLFDWRMYDPWRISLPYHSRGSIQVDNHRLCRMMMKMLRKGVYSCQNIQRSFSFLIVCVFADINLSQRMNGFFVGRNIGWLGGSQGGAWLLLNLG